MDLREAEVLAESLIEEYVPGTKLVWTRSVTVHALTRFRLRGGELIDTEIAISRPATRLCDLVEVRDTILHEIAHVLVGPGHGHGAAWQAVAKSVGAKPQENGDTDIRAQLAPWVGTCPAGHVSTARYYRKPTRQRSCGKCCKSFHPDHLLTYEKIGG
jgi:predicted SprT family Zn-dependent metalloprotease